MKERVKLKCPRCGLLFDNYMELMRHYTRMHSFMTFKIKNNFKKKRKLWVRGYD